MRFYNERYYGLMSGKLGLEHTKESEKVVDNLVEVMHACGTHFTNFFRIIEDDSQKERS